MKIDKVINEYIKFKQSMGINFKSEANTLMAFCRALGDCDICNITSEDVFNYISGNGTVTTFWHSKYRIIACFYRFAISRNYTTSYPLPRKLPKCPESSTPYIYSLEEVERLLTATAILKNARSPLQADTFKLLLLILYCTGIRISEALSLKLNDIDLPKSIITVKDTKFSKSRFVPVGPRLTNELIVYEKRRRMLPCPKDLESSFLATCNGNKLMYPWVSRIFRRLRKHAQVNREAHARYQPRMHDFRHTFAVYRLISWYKEGADVQRMLPLLATYLGHINLNSTQHYLTMVPELLQEASHQFEKYALKEAENA